MISRFFRALVARLRDAWATVLDALARANDGLDPLDAMDDVEAVDVAARPTPAPAPTATRAIARGVSPNALAAAAAVTADPWVKRYKLVDRAGRDVGVSGEDAQVALFRSWSAANRRRRAGETIQPVRVRQSSLQPTLVKPSTLAAIALCCLLAACASPLAPATSADVATVEAAQAAPADDYQPCALTIVAETIWINGTPYTELVWHCDAPTYGTPHVDPIVPVTYPDSTHGGKQP